MGQVAAEPLDEQVEVATMMGDFALYEGKPSLPCTRNFDRLAPSR
jgi:hypothetical protein